ncbi:MAG: DUF1538 domain-containing protein [Cryomorphaceae bacterium]|nr:DUF1538 domain-containing protein [Cryomorphaceae bacterium]
MIRHGNAALKFLKYIAQKLKSALFDLVPIILVVVFFQLVVLQQPFPDVADVLWGSLMVVVGLMLFIEGLEMGLFPIGEQMAYALSKKGSLFWLLIFAFALGFSTTIAEPALIAVTQEAARVSETAGLIASTEKAKADYALGLRLTVAFSVGFAILIGVLRILKGWPIYHLIIGGYIIVMLITLVAPEEIIGLAYDAGAVTTSTITVPLVAALGVGLAKVIKGRSPLIDGFGLIAFASLMPIIFVLLYGMIIFN